MPSYVCKNVVFKFKNPTRGWPVEKKIVLQCCHHKVVTKKKNQIQNLGKLTDDEISMLAANDSIQKQFNWIFSWDF